MKKLLIGIVSPPGQKMEDFLNSRVVGQEQAVRDIRQCFEIDWADMRDPRRPMANLFFTGLSGVGKTEMAKALAEYCFGQPHRLTIFDCNEFSEDHELAALKGAPPGYVGHRKSGSQINQWNLDRHHVEYLCETGSFFDDYVADRKVRLDYVSGKMQEIVKLIAESEERIRQLEREIENMGQAFDGVAKRVQEGKDTEENAQILRFKLQKDIEAAADEIQRLKAELKERRSFVNNFEERIKALSTMLERLSGIADWSPAARVQHLYELIDAEEYSHDAGKYCSIVLWNEIDKASPALHDLLLSIMDEGRLTSKDPPGVKVLFNNTINIFTANVRSDEAIRSRIGFGGYDRQLSEELLETTNVEIHRFFRPEFINRLSKIVVFRPLDVAAMRKVLDLRIEEINQRQTIKLRLLPKAKDFLVAEAMKCLGEGARLMTRRIEQFISAEIAPLKLSGYLQDSDTVVIKLGKDNQLEFFKK